MFPRAYQTVKTRTHANPGHGSSFQSFIGDMGYEIKIWGQLLDARVSGVDDKDIVPTVDGHAARLHEAFLLAAVAAECDKGRIVIGNVEE